MNTHNYWEVSHLPDVDEKRYYMHCQFSKAITDIHRFGILYV